MKLSTEQIKQIDQRLIDYGFSFIDIRIEVLDHIICLIEEKEYKDFPKAFHSVFEEQKFYLKEQKQMQWVKIASQRISILKDIFLNPVFFVVWLLCFITYNLLPYSNHEELLKDLDILPISIPILSYIIFVIYLFRSKNKITGTLGVYFSISFILMFYLYFGIHIIRKIEELPSLILLSGFTSISLMLYYLFFYYKKKNEKKFRLILNS